MAVRATLLVNGVFLGGVDIVITVIVLGLGYLSFGYNEPVLFILGEGGAEEEEARGIAAFTVLFLEYRHLLRGLSTLVVIVGGIGSVLGIGYLAYSGADYRATNCPGSYEGPRLDYPLK
ncbi:hypothetical protein QBC39DRAFT_332351 [Podospora conica]|nr:hypothetical protein QBC39DRAFT_332351 [Schizothecium conicum]